MSGGGWLIKSWRPGDVEPRIIAAKASFYPDPAKTKALREMVLCLEALVDEVPLQEFFRTRPSRVFLH